MRYHHSLLHSGPVALLLAVTAGSSKGSGAPRAAVPVGVAVARRAAVPYTIAANGLVTPMQVATVAPQVDGIITRVTFHEGQSVARSQVLFEIEPRPYVAAYQQALGALARDVAQLESARLDESRYADIVDRNYGTMADYEAERAAAAALEATVRSDSGMVATAKFNLENTTIRAPIEGRTGGLLVREGNLVHAAGMTPLVVINQIQPILVRFAVPGSDLTLIRRYGALGGVPVPAGLTGQQGPYVYVVDSAGAAQQRPVRLERTAGSLAVIASGVGEGDVVVTDGQSRLTPGVKVTTNTSDSTPPKGPAARHR